MPTPAEGLGGCGFAHRGEFCVERGNGKIEQSVDLGFGAAVVVVRAATRSSRAARRSAREITVSLIDELYVSRRM
jgi:hypothetical protein